MSNTTRRKVRWDGERMCAYVVRDAVRCWTPEWWGEGRLTRLYAKQMTQKERP